nr:polyprenyl synthetase family protein [Corynebacterium sp. UBA5992]
MDKPEATAFRLGESARTVKPADSPEGFLNNCTQESVTYLEEFLHDQLAAHRCATQHLDVHLLEYLHDTLTALATGGKHVRCRLVHLAAGQPATRAACVFGACVDLLHSAFLIHDDIIDEDLLRRGEPTVHALAIEALRERGASRPRIDGTSLGLLIGDLAMSYVYQILAEADLSPNLLRQAVGMFGTISAQTIIGELFDVEHNALHETHIAHIARSNHLKTSWYSFVLPLCLGAAAAGRDPEAFSSIGIHLGKAYQAGDDLLGASTTGLSGKAASDVEAGRATLLTAQLARGLSVEEATANVLSAVRGELTIARKEIDAAPIPSDVRSGLRGVADDIEKMVVGLV